MPYQILTDSCCDFTKEKYEVMSIKDKICSIFGD